MHLTELEAKAVIRYSKVIETENNTIKLFIPFCCHKVKFVFYLYNVEAVNL